MKKRLDEFIVDKGLAETTQKAQALIMAGLILVNEQKITKAGQLVDDKASVRMLGDQNPFVGRGGLKLQKALQIFNLDVTNRTCLDIGASTGGFTDCLLQNGAKKVFAIDVGYGQLDWKIRSDQRVVVLEKTNIRYLTPQQLYGSTLIAKATVAVIDVSFISLTQVLPSVKELIAPELSQVIALVKPQFEAAREAVPKGGVIKDEKIYTEVIYKVKEESERLEFTVLGETDSPISGADGNKEFFVWLKN